MAGTRSGRSRRSHRATRARRCSRISASLLQGRRAFLTARVTRGRPLLAGSRRVRLAVIRGAKFDIGPLIDRRDQQVPNTFSGAITGRLTMLSAMSRALERTRCKDRRRNRLSRRLRSGYVLGRFTAEVRPDRATGLAGNAQLRPTALDPVTAQPAAGSTLDGQGIIVAPIAAGSPVPLACVLGDQCIPSGGTFALGGGFELVLGDRRVLVSNLVTATTGTPPAALRQTVTGTLDGVPVTVADGDGSSEPLPYDRRLPSESRRSARHRAVGVPCGRAGVHAHRSLRGRPTRDLPRARARSRARRPRP